MAEFPSHIKEHGAPATEATMAIFCHVRLQLLMDSLADLFLRLIHAIKTSSEKFIDQRILAEVKCVHGKFEILYELSQTAAEKPDGIIQNEIYPKVSRETLRELAVELRSRGRWYQTQVKIKMRSLYSHAHRIMLLQLLPVFKFQTDREDCKLLLKAIDFIKINHNSHLSYYENREEIPLKNIISTHWQEIICKQDSNNLSPKIMPERIDQMNYEMAVLEALHDKLQCKAVWIEEAYRYRDPNEDLPADFDENTELYFKLLGLPLEEKIFVNDLKQQLTTALQDFNKNLPDNPKVKIVQGKKEAKFRISPTAPQAAPKNLDALHQTIQRV